MFYLILMIHNVDPDNLPELLDVGDQLRDALTEPRYVAVDELHLV